MQHHIVFLWRWQHMEMGCYPLIFQFSVWLCIHPTVSIRIYLFLYASMCKYDINLKLCKIMGWFYFRSFLRHINCKKRCENYMIHAAELGPYCKLPEIWELDLRSPSELINTFAVSFFCCSIWCYVLVNFQKFNVQASCQMDLD